ncbi:DUF6138 family protein [Flavobacterium sp. PL02]|uniref:DUF6138 family protein n=1 Tax=Flavobacterium sp. PL02 TaxID=3088354 RepID=UPI002B23A799|nr:DUF6138 family protein [Flavobacterium sp. PL02]MEA9414033.1 DUF6138 family protein [Flavobacterium sp. PL02]
MNTIEKIIIDNMMKGIVEVTKNDLKNHIGETAYSECEIQEGYHDYLKIQFKGQKIGLFIYDFDWDKTPYFKLEISEPIDNLPKENLIDNVIPILKQQISDFFFDKANQPMFRYCIKVILEFEYKNGSYKETFFIEDEERKLELQKRMNNYITKVIYNLDRKVKDVREITVFSGNLVNFNLMGFSPMKLIEIIEHCLNHTFKDIKNRKSSEDFERSILHMLNNWVKDEFKPLHFDISGNFSEKNTIKNDFKKENVNAEQLSLWVYTSFLRIKFKDYTQDALKDLEIASKDFGSETAKKYLNFGTGLFAQEDIHYKDKNIECKANDVFSTISVTIKNETSECYQKALDFIINLLQKGFPNSYSIKFSSKSEKQFLPIKGIAKSSTNRFFSNCLQYPELHDKIEQYALVAMKEFEWYNDVEEGEKSCLPGSYAVFGLGLTSEKYFPLVHKYFEILDDEHQMVHKYFINNLIDKYEVTKKSIVLICEGILSAQFEMTYKNLATLMNKEPNLELLINELEKLESYEVEEIIYSIWGRDYTKTILKLDSQLKELLLEQLKK